MLLCKPRHWLLGFTGSGADRRGTWSRRRGQGLAALSPTWWQLHRQKNAKTKTPRLQHSREKWGDGATTFPWATKCPSSDNLQKPGAKSGPWVGESQHRRAHTGFLALTKEPGRVSRFRSGRGRFRRVIARPAAGLSRHFHWAMRVMEGCGLVGGWHLIGSWSR